jgi:putative phosphoribosyl transferase
MVQFADRADAGRRLAQQLEGLRGQDAVVLGLTRGGVPVAHEVATALDLPMDVGVVRKLGAPARPELAMGAIGEGGFTVIDPGVVRRVQVSRQDLEAVARRERAVLESRVALFRHGRRRLDLADRTVVVVDDGVATGSTAKVAAQVARHLGAARVLLAVPVAPVEVADGLEGFDQVVCVATPRPFVAVGQYYRDFSPTTDAEVVALLDRVHGHGGPRRGGRARGQPRASALRRVRSPLK